MQPFTTATATMLRMAHGRKFISPSGNIKAPIKGTTDCARAAARWFNDAAGPGMAYRAC